MYITTLSLRNFRCFNEIAFDLDAPIVLITGTNGSGKSSILEAAHYLGYLRSFRTHMPRDMVSFGADGFFVKATVRDTLGIPAEFQAAINGNKRLVKLDGNRIDSYKQLVDRYRVVTVTEDDLDLIKGGPDIRRGCLDAALALHNVSYVQQLRTARAVTDQRNALLAAGNCSKENYALWTEQHLKNTAIIQQARSEYVSTVNSLVNNLFDTYWPGIFQVACAYMPKYEAVTENLSACIDTFYPQEIRFGRSVWGAHLDDLHISLQGRKSKLYASRGQQKLLVLIFKIAQATLLSQSVGPAVVLLDDFMTDFDLDRAALVFEALKQLNTQLIFTSPVDRGSFERFLSNSDCKHISMTPMPSAVTL